MIAIDLCQAHYQALLIAIRNLKKFPNTHQFCKDDLNKFVLLSRKGVYPYEYVDSWEKFYETSLPAKTVFTVN